MNYYEHHLGDYDGATAHLSWSEDCAYRRLICTYYRNEGPIPADIKQACRLVRAASKSERDAVQQVLSEFFELRDDGWHHKRCDEELGRYREKSAKARASAAVSVQVRQEKASMSNAQILAERMAAARAKGTHTVEQWVALRHVCGYRCVKCQATGHQDRDHIKPVYQGGSDAIENIQPLCARCNAAKGPESLDYRLSDWAASVQRTLNEQPDEFVRTLNERSTNAQHRAPVPSPQSPVTSNQTPEGETAQPAKRGSRLPIDWVPDPDGLAFAVTSINGRSESELAKFRDYWASQPGQKGVKTDWSATWRNWVRRASETKPSPAWKTLDDPFENAR